MGRPTALSAASRLACGEMGGGGRRALTAGAGGARGGEGAGLPEGEGAVEATDGA